MNAPWALLFSKCDKFLYVGNFGDGRINVFDLYTGWFIKPLKDCHGNIISIDGLWGLVWNNEAIGFAAGIDDEMNGLIGELIPCSCC